MLQAAQHSDVAEPNSGDVARLRWRRWVRGLRVEVDDEQYEQLVREVRELHEDLAVYAGRVLAQELDKARFSKAGLSSSAVCSCIPRGRRHTAQPTNHPTNQPASQPGTAT